MNDRLTVTPAVLSAYDDGVPEATGTATFGLGCFWGPDAAFGALDGVVRTAVGYAGGTKPDPSYRRLGDHTEVLRVEYDPSTISYRALLEVVFAEHSPRRQAHKRQYHNVVLLETDEQAETAEAFLEASDWDAEQLETRIERLDSFHLAEPYHQKYNLKSNVSLLEAFEEAGYDEADIRRSPVAAKLNGYVSGDDVSLPFLNARSK